MIPICPPVYCPACAGITLHKGSCEDEACGYDPRAAGEPLDGTVNYSVLLDLLWHYPGIEVRLYEHPFPRLAVASRDSAAIQRALLNILTLLDYPTWSRVVKGAFGLEKWTGFDFTHEMAKPFLDDRGSFPISRPCTESHVRSTAGR